MNVDLYQFLQLPRLNYANALSLMYALLAAAPKAPFPNVLKAVANLQMVADEHQSQWAERERQTAGVDTMAAVNLDRDLDSAWRATHSALESLARLSSERNPKAGKASALLAVLFPSGLAFLTLPFSEEWAHSGTILKRIDDEGLAAEIDQLVGPEFLAEVRFTHKAFGDAIGRTAPLPAEQSRVDYRDLLRAAAEAIRAYSLQLIAAVRSEPALSEEVVRTALKPIEELRDANARRAASDRKPAPAPVEG